MAPTPVQLHRSAANKVVTAFEPVTVFYGPMAGGWITNPGEAADQGLPVVQTLYADLTGPAAIMVVGADQRQPNTFNTQTFNQTAFGAGRTKLWINSGAVVPAKPTTFAVQPGQSFKVVPGQATPVSVVSASSGHRFSAVLVQPPTPFPPAPPFGPFPPTGPTSLTRLIASYLYLQYNDDDDLQAFVDAFNAMGQARIDALNGLNLPIYTQPQIAGPLLDWVAEGLYGTSRPTLPSGRSRYVGAFNTYAYNSEAFNRVQLIGPANVAATSDNIFKKILTWAIFKGDGRVFDVRWLKRRIMRFLEGPNGANFNVDQTYRISVSFGVNRNVGIVIINGSREVTGGAIYNRFGWNMAPFNSSTSIYTPFPRQQNAEQLKQAIDAGVLELPFQFTYNVSIQ